MSMFNINDKLIEQMLPPLLKLVQPAMDEAREGVHKLLMGDVPLSLRDELRKAFKGNFTEEDAEKIWRAVARATANG